MPVAHIFSLMEEVAAREQAHGGSRLAMSTLGLIMQSEAEPGQMSGFWPESCCELTPLSHVLAACKAYTGGIGTTLNGKRAVPREVWR